ncbi:hypothetical protein HYPSUDRAFT_185851 [Hypholoma sublateritium FD-334 SS-4]|uniref:CHAT domain-containing protein n=1 Tax=Hypholoma sublateritium (strain FD-334 SS-4) TaxID=945553 RepID=A0A0D2P259_HYPSF|nr:hypothetical protein HYPSUDRAFT_185851 [Hypholoma sublateritium FD-334 SS-4]
MLHIMMGDSSETLPCVKISLTKWRVDGNITLSNNTCEIMLFIQSRDGGDEAFLNITADEIFAIISAEEGTSIKHKFESVNEGNNKEFKMKSAVAFEFQEGDPEEIIKDRQQLLELIQEVKQAIAWVEKYKKTQDIENLKSAIAHYESAICLCPLNSHILCDMFINLGIYYFWKFEHTANIHDIEHAILHRQNAVNSTPSGHTELPDRLNSLGISYIRRFEYTGNIQDIECAISHIQNAVNSTPFGDVNLPNRLNNLGCSYLCQFEHTGNIQEIEHAILHFENAVNSTPSGHTQLPSRLNNLGNSYIRRFEHTGNIQDIEHATLNYQNADNSTPSGHADKHGMLSNLGYAYLSKFEHTGNTQDIDHAIFHCENSLNSTPPGHPSLLRLQCNLGNAYIHQFKHTNKIQSIEHAILHIQNAVNSIPPDHADLPGMLNNLGSSYHCQFVYTGNIEDIEHAILHQQNAVNLTPSDHTDLPSWLNNLGNSYRDQFQHTQNIQDIEQAIIHQQNAIKSTPTGHPSLCKCLKNIGKSYHDYFEFSHLSVHIQNSISSYRQASMENGAPFLRLEAAKNAAALSIEHDKAHCLNDFSIAINLLSEVAGLEKTIHQRHVNLHSHSKFVSIAIASALLSSRFDLALEWFENGRCLVWHQLSQLRAPIDSLCIKFPSLAEKLIQAANALESYGPRSELYQPPSMDSLSANLSLQKDNQNHTHYAITYKKLLKEIRQLPDFHNFLKPPTFSTLLVGLPKDGPIIIFNIQRVDCNVLALVDGSEEPLHILLKDFSLADAKKLQDILQFNITNKGRDEDRLGIRWRAQPDIQFVLRELWCKVVKPILEALGFLSVPPELSNRPRIWWCPTGPISFLPLHAAGVYGSECPSGSCVSDFVVSSYTPTIHSIQEKFKGFAASSTLSEHTKILLISQPNTPDPKLPPILCAKKESHMLEDMMEKNPHVNALLLEDGDATIEKVKTELQSHNWVHFACHGIQDPHEPLESGVYLHNGRLKLLEIMQQKIENPKLAFFSACQTSKGDNNLSEEVVHLAAGMLSAGYCGVIGTMWSISDAYGPVFAKWFYQYLLDETESNKLDSTHAAYALDYATRKVRKTLGQSNRDFLTWVPYVHFGY